MAFGQAAKALLDLVEKAEDLAADPSCFIAAQEEGNLLRAEKLQNLREVQTRILKAQRRLISMNTDVQELTLWDSSLFESMDFVEGDTTETCPSVTQPWVTYREKAKDLLDSELVGSFVAGAPRDDWLGEAEYYGKDYYGGNGGSAGSIHYVGMPQITTTGAPAEVLL